ncbi:MAG: HAMP domain-containing sensor histidine kinase [candidate division Zixibacteria bacterium]|nr:HAMP domain-containing sensor histidine kinase [candidate division Zixibacteria bacterium]
MILKRDRQPTRTALIIFLALVVFSVAQLSWWIIFQINTGTTQRELCLKNAHEKGALASTLVNDRFRRLSLISQRIFIEFMADTSRLSGELFLLLEDPALTGYSIVSADRLSVIRGGALDSTFYHTIAPGAVIYFNASYPMGVISSQAVGLTFTVSGRHNGAGAGWVTPDMYAPSPGLLAQINDRTNRTITMFVFEGGFFFFIILLVAYLIYATLRRAEELKFAQQNFLYSVTHELKAPLASIRLYLQTIMSGKIDSERTQELLPKMIDDCDRLEGLIDNVLEAGHFSRDGYQLKLTAANLADDLQEYLDDLEPFVHRHGGTITRILADRVMVRTDYQAFRRVITALIDNAVKYSAPGRRDIAVTLESDSRHCRLSVRDYGQGIDKKEQPKIFDRFYRSADDAARQVRGTGLGLFLVREIVEAHRGKVTVESPGSDQGSTFIITLPLVKS